MTSLYLFQWNRTICVFLEENRSTLQKKFSSASSDGGGDNGEAGLILWTILSLSFLSYSVWRIQQLKEKTEKTSTSFKSSS